MSPRKQAPGEEANSRKELPTTDRQASELLLRACHDLRTPLRSIRAHAELLLRSHETKQMPDIEERLGFIVGGARRMDRLVDGLASYSLALQIDKTSFHLTPMDVLLRTVLKRLEKELRDNEAEVSCKKLPRVWGDPDRLIDLLENLLANALRHRGQAPPRIRITAGKQAEEWQFGVRDNGPGVDAAYLESIFSPFVRLPGKQLEGPGLGLAICRAIVEQHGGRIWAESEAGTGSTFLFTLPAA